MLQDDNKPAEQQPKAKAPKGYEAFSMLQDLVYMLSVITILFVFFFRLVGVDGSSMYPTFVDQDYLVLESNVLYRDIEAGDIVVMNVPYFENEGPIVKRVIATGGQTVDIEFDSGEVYVDGARLDEPYTFEPTYESYGAYGVSLDYPVTVPEGSIFVMGDNRNHSADSRFAPVGCVDESCVLGKVLLIVFPGEQTDQYGSVTGKRQFSRIGAAE